MDNLPSLSFASLVKGLYRPVRPLRETVAPFINTDKKHLYGFASGREAITALVRVNNWKNVGLPAFTCPILYGAIINAGAKPCVIDVDRVTYNLDAREPFPSGLDAVIVVHTFGNPADISKIRKKLPAGTAIIEDCAHMLGSGLRRDNISSQGNYILLSLYKQAANFGGAALLSSKRLNLSTKPVFLFPVRQALLLLAEIRPLVNLCRRCTALPSSLDGVADLHSLPALWTKIFSEETAGLKAEMQARFQTAEIYRAFLDEKLFAFQSRPQDSGAIFNFSFQVRFGGVQKRDRLLLELRRQGIFADRQWYNSITDGAPAATEIAQRIINLPIKSVYSEQFLKTRLGTVNSLAQKIADD